MLLSPCVPRPGCAGCHSTEHFPLPTSILPFSFSLLLPSLNRDLVSVPHHAHWLAWCVCVCPLKQNRVKCYTWQPVFSVEDPDQVELSGWSWSFRGFPSLPRSGSQISSWNCLTVMWRSAASRILFCLDFFPKAMLSISFVCITCQDSWNIILQESPAIVPISTFHTCLCTSIEGLVPPQ